VKTEVAVPPRSEFCDNGDAVVLGHYSYHLLQSINGRWVCKVTLPVAGDCCIRSAQLHLESLGYDLDKYRMVDERVMHEITVRQHLRDIGMK